MNDDSGKGGGGVDALKTIAEITSINTEAARRKRAQQGSRVSPAFAMRDTAEAELDAELEARERRRAALREAFFDPNHSTAAMLATEPAAQEYVIDGILPVREGGILIGAGGAGKGMLQILAGLAIATGTNFGPFLVPKPRRVLLVNFEDDQAQLHRRLRATAATLFHLDAIDLGEGQPWRELAEDNLHVVSLRAQGVSIEDTELHDVLAEKAERIGGVDSVWLDPLGRIQPRGAFVLNSQEGAGRIHAAIDRLVATLGCAVTVAHHASKAGQSTNPRDDLGAAAATGSQMLVDLARYAWRIAPMRAAEVIKYELNADQRCAELTIPKNNQGPTVERSVVFRRLRGGALDYVPTRSKVEVLDEKVLEALGSETLTLAEWEARCAEQGIATEAAKESRGRLIRTGQVTKGKLEDNSPGKRGTRPATFTAAPTRGN